jgi:hypothetical protein
MTEMLLMADAGIGTSPLTMTRSQESCTAQSERL